jgi:hypothetical protein
MSINWLPVSVSKPSSYSPAWVRTAPTILETSSSSVRDAFGKRTFLGSHS